MSELTGFVGSWLVTATDQDQSELSLATVGANGIMMTSPRPVFPPFGPSAESVFTSAGHGAWELTGPDSGNVTFVVLTADRQGNPLMTVTVRAHVTLGNDGQSWSGEGIRSFADQAGNTIATQPAVVHATRIVAEAPDMATAPTPAAASRAG